MYVLFAFFFRCIYFFLKYIGELCVIVLREKNVPYKHHHLTPDCGHYITSVPYKHHHLTP
jgi:hypothetical protein